MMMAVEWREFEQFVARIEKSLAPHGAVVTCPDRVKDLITGQDREVDASVRFTVGSVPILITIECRRRDRVQDDTWLEQLAMKRQKIGAAKTIAVASAGFTVPATVTASFTGIEVRTIGDITSEAMINWLKITGIEQVVGGMELVSFHSALYGEAAQLHEDVMRQMEADAAYARVFFEVAKGDYVCLNDFVTSLQQGGLDLHAGVPGDGTKVRRQLALPIPPDSLQIMTETGPRFLSYLWIGLDVFAVKTFIPLPSGFEYSNTEDSIVKGIEHRPDLPGIDCIMTLVREPESEWIKLGMLLRKKPEEGAPEEKEAGWSV
ncbi:MAG: hypothetical protein P4L84_35490 [Isosphaeraceae bacterium]|nr:hypothetical protein [Isosphaeraceae bacterium]